MTSRRCSVSLVSFAGDVTLYLLIQSTHHAIQVGKQ
jgi:hypothetical protein